MESNAAELNNLLKSHIVSADKTKILLALLKEPLCVPAVNISGQVYEENKWEILKSTEIARVKIIKNSKGQESLPVFTDKYHLQLWMPQGSFYQALYGEDILNVSVINNFDGLVLNPGSDMQFEIFGIDVKNILNRN